MQLWMGLLLCAQFAQAQPDLSDGIWRCMPRGLPSNFFGPDPKAACDAFLDGTILDGHPLRRQEYDGACDGVAASPYRVDEMEVVECTKGWAGDLFSASCTGRSTINICGAITTNVGEGYFYAKTQAAPKVLKLSGPHQTRALPAGPPVPLVATVTQNGYPIAGVSVGISVNTGAVDNNQGGATDAAGKLGVVYSPPSVKTVSTVTATCYQCTPNTVQHVINVDPCPDCAIFGNPISGLSGEKLQRETDWASDGVDPLQFTRFYRSYGNVDAGLGGNWSHNYVVLVVGVDNERRVQFGDGRTVLFSRANELTPWVADHGQDSLVVTASGWLYTRNSDQTGWSFDGSNRLSSIAQRNGAIANLVYNAAGRVTEVTNGVGRRLQLNYDAAGHLASVVTPDAKTINYQRDANGRLSSVQQADGSVKTYLYENGTWPQALTGVVDELGQRYATYTYESGSGLALSTSHSNGADYYGILSIRTWRRVPTLSPGSSYDATLYQTEVDLVDPLGGVQTWRYQGGDGTVRLLGVSSAFDGGQVASSTFVSGTTLPAAETDFLGVQTVHAWDLPRRLPLSTTKANGQPEAQTTSTQWHPTMRLPVLVTEPTRSTAYSYDTAGNKITETITDTVTSRTTSWVRTYTPLGQVATVTDPNNRLTTYSYYTDTAFTGVDPNAIGHTTGDLQSITNPAGHITSFTSYDKAGRIRQSIDAKGITTDTSYTPRGWVSSTSVTPPGGTPRSTSYSYDAAGQLKVVTQPDGSTVTYSYDAAHRLIGIKDAQGNEVAYTLDNAGNRTAEQIKDPSGVLQRSINRSFDALNRLQQVSGAVQ